MNEPIFLCKTDADFIYKTFCFKDGVAYFYGKIKDGVIQYYVHDAHGESGPFKIKPQINVFDSLFNDKKGLLKKSIKNLKWYAGQYKSYIHFVSHSFMDDDDFEDKDDFQDDDHPMTQDKIGQLLDSIAAGKSEWKDGDSDNKEENPEFVTPSKKYGPYDIYLSAYKDKNNFQFIYKKGDHFHDSEFFYNYNGKEIEIGKTMPRIFYDVDGHAICDGIDKNYFFIDGIKTDYFNGEGTEYNYNKDENHTLIAANVTHDKNTVFYLLDGQEHYIHTKGTYEIYKAQAIITRRTKNNLETHYYNETPISVPVPSSYHEDVLSYIFGSGITYTQQGIPQLLLGGKTYNASPACLSNNKNGFIYLSNGALYFQKYNYSNGTKDDFFNNVKRLFDNHLLAGE